MLSEAQENVYLEILAAVGLLTPDMSATDAFFLAGKVQRDQIVMKRKIWNADGSFRREKLETTVEVIEEFTDEERTQLRERVCAR
jgi:hypothetical protein